MCNCWTSAAELTIADCNNNNIIIILCILHKKIRVGTCCSLVRSDSGQCNHIIIILGVEYCNKYFSYICHFSTHTHTHTHYII